MAGSIADAFEAGRVSDWRRWRWRRFVSFIERERVTVESEALAVPARANKHTCTIYVRSTLVESRSIAVRDDTRRTGTLETLNRSRGSNYTRSANK